MTGVSRRPDEPSPEDVREEIAFHLEERTKDLIARGVDPDEAARRAREAFGDARGIEAEILSDSAHAHAHVERVWSRRGWIGDVRLAMKSLRRSPGFSVGVAALLAVGIGVTTAVFAVVDAVVIRPLAYPDPDALVELTQGSHSPADFVIWEEQISTIAMWGGVWNDQADLTGDDFPQRAHLGRVTRDFFSVLGARATQGRLFASEDFGLDPRVVVVSYDFWRTRWGGDPGVVGRTMRLGGQSVTVVGVLSADFDPLVMGRGLGMSGPPQVWIPADMDALVAEGHGFHVFQVVGRLAQGVDIQAAEAEMRALSESLSQQGLPNHTLRDGTARHTPWSPLKDRVIGSADTTGFMLLGAVSCLLLIGCVNAANLFLARGAKRAREMSLKGALGASRRNLLTQLGAESIALSLAAGALGVALAMAGIELFRSIEPGTLLRIGSVGVSWRVLSFAVITSVATGVVFGLLPAMRAGRADPGSALKDDSARSTEGRRGRWARNGLVVAEIALSVLLLAGAGILFRSFLTLTSVETGFETSSQVVTVDLRLSESLLTSLQGWDSDSESQAEAVAGFVDQVMDRLTGTVPGAGAVFAAPSLPFQFADGGVMGRSSLISSEDSEPIQTLFMPVTDDYFSGLGIPLLEGRDIGESDVDLRPMPVVVDETVAARLFPDGDPVGQTFDLVGNPVVVAGVAADVRFAALEMEPTPTVYLPWKSLGPEMPFVTLGIQTESPLNAVTPIIRDAIWQIDPDLPIPEISTMDRRIARSVAGKRYLAALFAGFAIIAGLMAGGGLYGTLLYTARQRQREMGIRVAIGAARMDLLRMVLVEGAVLAVLGIAIGLLGVWAGGNVLESYVFGIAPRDPLTLTVVAAALGTIAAAVCLVPAVRATSIDPMTTLRAE